MFCHGLIVQLLVRGIYGDVGTPSRSSKVFPTHLGGAFSSGNSGRCPILLIDMWKVSSVTFFLFGIFLKFFLFF